MRLLQHSMNVLVCCTSAILVADQLSLYQQRSLKSLIATSPLLKFAICLSTAYSTSGKLYTSIVCCIVLHILATQESRTRESITRRIESLNRSISRPVTTQTQVDTQRGGMRHLAAKERVIARPDDSLHVQTTEHRLLLRDAH